VSSSLINRTDEETNTEGTLAGVSSLNLALLANLSDEALTGMETTVGVPVVEALVAHKFGQEASVSSHTRNANAHMSVDLKYFFLMVCQIMG